MVLSISVFVPVRSAVINSGSYFNQPGDVLIDFESMPGASGIPGDGTVLSNQYTGLLFRSELRGNPKQNTDKADSLGRFTQSFAFYAQIPAGGAPTSGVRYASSTNPSGWNVPDMRVDFSSPVEAFGLWIIDNDFSTARISAFNSSGGFIESVVIPAVSEGGKTYRGIAAPGISYFILDGNNNSDLDSTLIDDLSYRPSFNSEVPEPSTLATFFIAFAFVGYRKRIPRFKKPLIPPRTRPD
jgi:hypothetical protein